MDLVLLVLGTKNVRTSLPTLTTVLFFLIFCTVFSHPRFKDKFCTLVINILWTAQSRLRAPLSWPMFMGSSTNLCPTVPGLQSWGSLFWTWLKGPVQPPARQAGHDEFCCPNFPVAPKEGSHSLSSVSNCFVPFPSQPLSQMIRFLLVSLLSKGIRTM